jgi:death on curing protein
LFSWAKRKFKENPADQQPFLRVLKTKLEKPTLFELAAEYALEIVKNHPFWDGNKRAGFMAACIFLGANGQDLDAPETEAVFKTTALAAGEIGADEYPEWLKESCA